MPLLQRSKQKELYSLLTGEMRTLNFQTLSQSAYFGPPTFFSFELVVSVDVT